MSVAYEHTPIAPKRRVIASKARAAAIIEGIADKHSLPVQTLLCAKWDRFAMIARAEAAHALVAQLNWSIRGVGAHLGCSHTNVRKLLGFHEKSARRIVRLVSIQCADEVAVARVRELEAELQRLSGTYLSEKLASRLDVPLRCAILLSILIESYPRYVRGPALLQLYDDACEKLGYGARNGANFDLVTKHACDLAAAFKAGGWPVPSEVGELKGSRRLTDACAVWLSEGFGAPRRSVIEAFKEQHADAAGSLAVRAMGA